MDFFSRQERVERVSRSFFFAFLVCVVLTVLILWALSMILIVSPLALMLGAKPATVQAGWFYLVSLAIIGPLIMLAILTISARYTRAISEGGGVYVAEGLGAEELLKPESGPEKQLINVIEEMAVASVLPRPRVYIMRDQFSINAFTAGLTPEQTVVVVTQGLVEKLNRDEMQAVAAHELAHILNGDSSLALRIGGWLYGLEYLTMRAEDMIDSVNFARSGFMVGSGGLFIRMWLVSILFYVAGMTGRIMGRVLESLFSQQREFLADAFAAQFTRNPLALAGALKKIGSVTKGGSVRCGRAQAFNSYFFACPARHLVIFDSHPPLADRILALEPDWDGLFPQGRLEDFFRPRKLSAKELREEKLKLDEDLRDFLVADEEAVVSPPRGLNQLVQHTGNLKYLGGALVGSLLSIKSRGSGLSVEKHCPTENDWHVLAEAKSLAAAQLFLSNLSDELKEAAVDLDRIPALAAAVLLDDQPDLRQNQLNLIERILGPKAAQAADRLKERMQNEERLPLLNLAAPGLRALNTEVKSKIILAVKSLIAADKKLDLFELAAGLILEKYLDLHILSPAENPIQRGTYDPLAYQTEVVVVLSVLCYVGLKHKEGADAKLPFIDAMSCFTQWPPAHILRRNELGTKALLAALCRLKGAPENIKRTLMLAAVTAALHDREVNPGEYEILAALGAVMDVPSPFLKLYALEAESRAAGEEARGEAV